MQISDLQVLIIDDSPMTLSVVKQILNTFGTYHVYEAGDGMSALELVATCNPDLILCDLNMEPMNGFDFVQHLRSDRDNPAHDTPVIFLTSHAEPEMVTKAKGLHIHGYLLKPISPRTLTERIMQVIKRLDKAS